MMKKVMLALACAVAMGTAQAEVLLVEISMTWTPCRARGGCSRTRARRLASRRAGCRAIHEYSKRTWVRRTPESRPISMSPAQTACSTTACSHPCSRWRTGRSPASGCAAPSIRVSSTRSSTATPTATPIRSISFSRKSPPPRMGGRRLHHDRSACRRWAAGLCPYRSPGKLELCRPRHPADRHLARSGRRAGTGHPPDHGHRPGGPGGKPPPRLIQALCCSGTLAKASFRAAKQAGSSALPTVFSIISSACGTGIAPR